MATTTAEPQRSPEEIEDIIIRKIFLVTLTDSTANDARVVYLEMMAVDILSKGKELRLSRDLMGRVIVDRLSGNFTSAESPFQYLIGIYDRAHEEGKKIVNMKDKSVKSRIELVVNHAMKLAVSYCRIHLGNPDKFHSSERDESSVSPLLPLIFSEVSSSNDAFGGGGVGSCPPGFLNEFFKDSDFDGMEPIMKQLYENLREEVLQCSALGNFQLPLRALMYLIHFPIGAKALENPLLWIPEGTNWNGRGIEIASILGPFFHVSALPDHIVFRSPPDVGYLCFSESSTRPPADLLSSYTAIRTAMNILYHGLTQVLRFLFKNKNTRENVLRYIAELISKNASRAHIQVDPMSCASSGMFVNLSAVMLRLCEPFLGANSMEGDKIDPKYVLYGSRLDFKGLTALHASPEEVAEWLSNGNDGENWMLNSQEAMTSGSGVTESSLLQKNTTIPVNYSFTCECFFMTARVLNLGLLKALSDFKHLLQDISRLKDGLSILKAMQEQTPSPRLVQEAARLEQEIESFTQEKLCYNAQIGMDVGLLQQALSFYQLMVAWLVGCIGGFRMPLPPSCPKEFACIPEHFVEDAMELLTFVSPDHRALDGVQLEGFMSFIIMFMASPEYIRNPYLRAKMVKVLKCWLPRRSGSSVTSMLFEGHQLSVQYLVRNLLKLYLDIEFTGSNTRFNDKFNIRHHIAKLLEYLWQVPVHQYAWKQIAEEEKGVYLNFLNHLINDSLFLLDESLSKILELKALKAEMSNTSGWEQRPAEDRQDKARLLRAQETMIRINLKFVTEDVSILASSTEQITSPFLLPEMVERVSSMLNYFLLQLVGLQRKSLSLKDPHKYKFRPEQLLKQIVNIYVHLARGDGDDIFAAAITKDGHSYNDQLFTEAANVLRRIGDDQTTIQTFEELGEKAKAAAAEAMAAKAVLGDIPDEFLDPIQYTLMNDPVILPSSRITVDQPVIQRHLQSDTTDPFNHSHLTPDMLIPDTDLKGEIESFVKPRKRKQHGQQMSRKSPEASFQSLNDTSPLID